MLWKSSAALTVLASILLAPALALAHRPATEAEVAGMTVAAQVFGQRSARQGETYEPTLKEPTVSTVDETWATAFLEPTAPGWSLPVYPAAFHWTQLEGWKVENGNFFGCTDSVELSAEARADLGIPLCASKEPPPFGDKGHTCSPPAKTSYVHVQAFSATCSTARKVLSRGKCLNAACTQTRLGRWECHVAVRRHVTQCEWDRGFRRIVARS